MPASSSPPTARGSCGGGCCRRTGRGWRKTRRGWWRRESTRDGRRPGCWTWRTRTRSGSAGGRRRARPRTEAGHEARTAGAAEGVRAVADVAGGGADGGGDRGVPAGERFVVGPHEGGGGGLGG